MTRRNGTMLARFGPAVKAAVICLVTCGLGLGYVWQKQQIAQLGKEIKGLEMRLGDLNKENKELGDTLAQLKSPQVLDQLVKQWHLELEMPRPSQVVVLEEKSPTRADRDSSRPTQTASR
ncbi:MAG: hypothetical protein CMO66_03560 [Verrucomicrobiales bacterium]|nr:hypothetical protein [Verrucomicrobiales bacterium]